MTTWSDLAGPLLYAHRGAALEQPENSIEAFESAIAVGADVLEIDVHMTRDAHVVVAHDPGGRRVAAVDAEIRSSSLSEIKRWDLARDRADRGPRPPVRIPTLDEVLRAFPNTLLNIDVKQRQPDMTRVLVDLIARHAAHDRVLLTSFASATTRRLRRLGYPGPTGLARGEVATALFLPSPLRWLAPVTGRRMQIPTQSGALRLDRAAVVKRAHGLGLRVDYWVINDPQRAEQLLALGADGIVTDDPRKMARVFADNAATEGWRTRHPSLRVRTLRGSR